MPMSSSDIKEILVKENLQFKELVDTHRSYENRLIQLTRRNYLTADEEVEISEIKKKKLNVKDRIHLMMNEYQNNLS